MMLIKITIELVDGDVSPFELGNIQICNEKSIIESSQLMMIFLSLSDLLDVVNRLILKRPVSEIKFTSTDSYFEIFFGIKRNTLTIRDPKTGSSINGDISLFSNILFYEISNFYEQYSNILEVDYKYYDLRDSLKSFKISASKLGFL